MHLCTQAKVSNALVGSSPTHPTNSLQGEIMKIKKLVDDEQPNECGWIITEEDDILDPWCNGKKLQEGLDVVDWSTITPCDILYCETSVQHTWEETKRRPILVLYKSGMVDSPKVYGMKITTVPIGDGYRSKFKYELKDWH